MRKELAGMVIALLIMVLPVSASMADEDADFLNALANVINAISALEETGERDEHEQPPKQAAKGTSKEASLSISCSSVVVGSSAKTVWYVDGQKFTLKRNQTKTFNTNWGKYKFDALGNYEKIE